MRNSKQNYRSRSARMVAAALGSLLLVAPLAPAADFSQAGAQLTAANTNYSASNDSMEASSTNAMIAVMNLSALNIPGAFSHGYQAYGQYINSEKLDNMQAKAQANRNTMTSFGGGSTPAGSSKSAGPTTFSRLNPDYLRRGEAGTVADEFEKRSGMAREEFLRQLGAATDSDLTWGDSDLSAKLEARFQNFLQAIPNKDFKSGLQKAAAMFPASARSEALEKLASFYSESWNGTTPAPVVAAQGVPSAISVPSTQPVTAGAESTGRSPASEAAPTVTASQVAGAPAARPFLGLDQSADPFRDLLASADARDQDISLFRKVTNRYRLLTPALVGQH